MRGAYCCRTVASVDRHCPKVEGGRKRWERVGEGGRGVAVKAGWDGIGSQCLAPAVEGEAMDVTL
jgi:hypothetical protein